MKIHVRYFASLREALGSGEVLELPSDSSIAHVRDHLLGQGGAYAQVLARSRAVRCACDQKLCDESQRLNDGAEVAFFPPVTGG